MDLNTESLTPILTKLSFEMSCYEVIEDILCLYKWKEDSDYRHLLFMLDIDFEDFDSMDIEVILMTKLVEIDDESVLMGKIIEIYNELLLTPDSVLRPYQQHFTTENGENRVTLENFQEKFNGLAKVYFRFELDQVIQLMEVLQMPSHLLFNGYRTTSIEAICVSLHRLSSQCRFVDLSMIYDRLPQFLSQIFSGTMIFIFRKFGDTVRSFEHDWTTDRARLDDYALRIQEKGCPLSNCVAFVDGSHVPVARPIRGQRSMYCGHHKCHCLKMTVLQYANGLMTAFGPFDGNTHDSTAAQMIELDELIRRNYTFEDVTFRVFGDSGYAITPSIITPFRRGPGQTRDEADWNRQMSAYRITVEWGIGRVKNLWKAVTNKGNMKALLSPVSLYWFNAVLLTNIHCCMNGSQISQYFDCDPPTVQEYLRL